MKAPCGIEIKVGQVWQSARGFLWHIDVSDEINVRVKDAYGRRGHYVSPFAFTNKRGGYKLVKDVEAQ